MKTKIKNRIIYLLIIICLIIAIFLIFFYSLSNDQKTALKLDKIDSATFSDKPFPEYDNDLKLPKSMIFKGVIYSKTRSPIEKFVYQNSYIFLYRLPIISNKPLSEILKINYTQSNTLPHSDYYELTDLLNFKEHSLYSIFYKAGGPISGTEINFTLLSTDIKILNKNDTLYTCNAQLGNFSINYDGSNNVDFYGEERLGKQLKYLPIQITFKQKNGHYYMFLMIQRG